jgi:transcriptional regulator with XRE-family HTH domain
MDTLAANLRRLRTEKGLAKDDLAYEAEVSRSYLAREVSIVQHITEEDAATEFEGHVSLGIDFALPFKHFVECCGANYLFRNQHFHDRFEAVHKCDFVVAHRFCIVSTRHFSSFRFACERIYWFTAFVR